MFFWCWKKKNAVKLVFSCSFGWISMSYPTKTRNISGTKKKKWRHWAMMSFSLTRCRCPCLKADPYRDLFSFLLSNTNYPLDPQHREIRSWAEADGIQSMEWWQDWATRVWNLVDPLFSCDSHKTIPLFWVYIYIYIYLMFACVPKLWLCKLQIKNAPKTIVHMDRYVIYTYYSLTGKSECHFSSN